MISQQEVQEVYGTCLSLESLTHSCEKLKLLRRPALEIFGQQTNKQTPQTKSYDIQGELHGNLEERPALTVSERVSWDHFLMPAPQSQHLQWL